MTDTTRNLIIKLTSHMAYMQGQLEAHHELDDLEDYYWYRESVALRQQVADALAADEPAVPEGREPASVIWEPSDEELLELTEDWPATSGPRHDLSGCPEVPLYSVFADEVVEFARAVLSRYGHQPAPPAAVEQRHPAPVPVASDIYFEFVISDADYCREAGGSAPTYAQALSEGQHYLAQCLQDGPHTLELRRVEVLHPGAFPVPDDAPVPLPDDAQVIEPADLLSQRHPAPVPVSARLPGDALCWWYEPDEDDDGSGYGGKWTLLRIRGAVSCYTHWLPAHALPLPAGEVE